MKRITLGTRESQLALWQTRHLIQKLSDEPERSFQILTFKSTGDQSNELPFEKLEGKGFFTKELDQALSEKEIDIAVHSLKDIPTLLPENLEIAAVTQRHDPRDVLIGKKNLKLSELPQGAVIATGSLRRRSQLLSYRTDLNVVGLRGNLQTRYKKFYESDWDGMILAGAGVDRLDMSETITERVSLKVMVPAVGQGSLGVMVRSDDVDVKSILEKLNDQKARIASLAERSFLSQLGGGCTSPIACHGAVDKDMIHLEAFVGDSYGKRTIQEKVTHHSSESETAGKILADKMMEMGAHQILGVR